MKSLFFRIQILSFLIYCIPTISFAATTEALSQNSNNQNAATFERAEILSAETIKAAEGEDSFIQRVTAEITTGDFQETQITVDHAVSKDLQTSAVERGDTVIVVETLGPQGATWYIVDHYRIPSFLFLFLFFVAVALFFARKKALFAILGLASSILILTFFVVPQIAQGRSPFLIGILGAAVIMSLSLYIAHGFQKQTTIAFISIAVTVCIASVIASIAVFATQLFGFGSEAAYDLQFFGQDIELRGLLLAGMIIGLLGVLDDVTTSLVATIDQLYEANPQIEKAELYRRGLTVGREHIVSLINTLVLAYAGAGLPLLLLFSGDQQPFWVTLNSQLIGEEIVRTLVGSIALVLAVPITTGIAVISYFKDERPKKRISLE